MVTVRSLLNLQPVRVALFSAAVLLYAGFYLVSHGATHSAWGTVGFLFPVIFGSLCWGWKGGALTSVGGVVLNFVILLALQDMKELLSVTVQGSIFYPIVGIGVGYLRDTVRSLREAREEIRTLTGLLPICMYCKSIRDDTGHWHKLESYLHQHTGLGLTHGICPDCMRKASASLKVRY